MDYEVHGILQARILESVAFPFSRGSSQPRDQTQVYRTAGRFFTSWTTRKAHELRGATILLKPTHAKSLQSCLILCDPTGCSLPGSFVHGILQARILEWIAMPSSRGSPQPRDQIQVSHIAYGFFIIWATRKAQEYWSGWPIPSPVDLPHPGIQPGSPGFPYNISHIHFLGESLILFPINYLLFLSLAWWLRVWFLV